MPEPDVLTRPFWDAATAKRLVVQRCESCYLYQHPPARLCKRCDGSDLTWTELSGRGTVHSTSVMRDSRVRLLRAEQPFVVAVVEVIESPDVFMITNLPGSLPGEAEIGDPVEVCLEEVAPGSLIPQFRLARSTVGEVRADVGAPS